MNELKTPYISIIVPVYNVEAYLCTCLDSIVDWIFTDWEAILIDDGSKDKSGAICDEYVARDPRFKVIHQTNAGVSAARNVGLDRAKGVWIWFVDSDDLIDSGLPVDRTLLDKYDLVIYNLQMFADGEEIQRKLQKYSHSEIGDAKEILLKNNISSYHQSLWYHRDWCAAQIRFTHGIRLGEDGEFMRKCEILCKKPVRINYCNYYYRIRQGSATQSPHTHQALIEDTLKVLCNLLLFMVEHKVAYQPWLALRMERTLRSLLNSASLSVNGYSETTILQKEYRTIVNAYKKAGYPLCNKWLLKLAYQNMFLCLQLLKVKKKLL